MPESSESLIHNIHIQDSRRWQAIVAVLLVFFLGLGYLVMATYQNSLKQNQQLQALKSIQQDQTKTLDQLVGVGGQVDTTTKESQAHIDCIAQLFAKFTRDGQPITIIDLNSCQALAITRAFSQGSTSNTQPSTAPPSSPPPSSSPSTQNPFTPSVRELLAPITNTVNGLFKALGIK